MRNFNLQDFVKGYMTAALWASCGPEDGPYACENLDDRFDIDDIAPECAAAMLETCTDFCKANHTDLIVYAEKMKHDEWTGEAMAGHDFWLTRNGHGAGFWDRGLGDLGERLSSAAKVYGSVDLYPCADGKISGE